MNHIQETTFKSCLTYLSEYNCATHVRLGMRALSRLSIISQNHLGKVIWIMTRAKAIAITGNCVSTKQRALLLKRKGSSYNVGLVKLKVASFVSNSNQWESCCTLRFFCFNQNFKINLMWPNAGFIKLIRRVRSERSSDIQWMKQHERWTNATSQTLNASQTINGAQQNCTRARDNTRKQNNVK